MKWPPLIEGAPTPWTIRLRDVALTVLAWLYLLYLLRLLGLALLYAALDGLGVAHAPPPWPKGELVRDIVPFLSVVLLLVAWLVTFALARWNLLRDTRDATSQPAPLDRAVHDQHCGISPSQRSAMDESTILIVDVADTGQVVSVECRRQV
ncbi:hypothetical protein [Pseudoxanthomonas indica]|uniref:hypothetical protein n=1 Tax=Pseudoxanthomonas indica TaxID=428993 RepID=UPI0011162AA1|nr:hypothetical protein [Pseudoxanthomonas indica]